MGGGGVPRGGRPPNQTAYYVALAGILSLLLLLCCYFFYFFIKKVKELSQQMSPSVTPTTTRPPPISTATYPIQPVVRESATAMAKLCKQLPATTGGKSDTVFPLSTSPEAVRTQTKSVTPPPPPPPDQGPATHQGPPQLVTDKPAPPAAISVVIQDTTAR